VKPTADGLGDPGSDATFQGTILGKTGDYTLFTLTAHPTTRTNDGVPIGAYVSPFFYVDEQHTFFVEPSMTVWTIQKWQHFLIQEQSDPSTWTIDEAYINQLKVVADKYDWPKDDRTPYDPREFTPTEELLDWVTSPGTAIAFGDRLVMEQGGVPFTNVETGAGVSSGATVVTLNPASDVAAGTTIVLQNNGHAVADARLPVTQSLSVVGAGGMKPGLAFGNGFMSEGQDTPR
jgi:hypothetical protein